MTGPLPRSSHDHAISKALMRSCHQKHWKGVSSRSQDCTQQGAGAAGPQRESHSAPAAPSRLVLTIRCKWRPNSLLSVPYAKAPDTPTCSLPPLFPKPQAAIMLSLKRYNFRQNAKGIGWLVWPTSPCPAPPYPPVRMFVDAPPRV